MQRIFCCIFCIMEPETGKETVAYGFIEGDRQAGQADP